MHRINFTQPGLPGGQFDLTAIATAIPPIQTYGCARPIMVETPWLVSIDWSRLGQSGGTYEVPNDVATQNFQAAGFVQDNFRVTPKLTVNMGIRYEVSLPRTERFNRMNWLDPNLSFPLTAPGLPDLPSKVAKYSRIQVIATTTTLFIRFSAALWFRLSSTTRIRCTRRIWHLLFSTPFRCAGTGPWGYQGYDVQTPWVPTFQNAAILPGARLSDPFRSFQPPFPTLALTHVW